MTWKPHVTVAAVIEDNGKFLFVEEIINGELTLNQPAGHLEPCESIIDAVIRETREETTYEFQPTSLLGLYRYQLNTQDKTFLRYCFTGNLIKQLENAQLDPDIEQVVWLSYEELKQQSSRCRSPLVIRSLEDYLTGQQYPLDMIKELADIS